MATVALLGGIVGPNALPPLHPSPPAPDAEPGKRQPILTCAERPTPQSLPSNILTCLAPPHPKHETRRSPSSTPNPPNPPPLQPLQPTPSDDAPAPAPPRPLRRFLSWAFGLIVAYFAIVMVLKFARGLSLPHILASVRATPPLTIAGGVALVMTSYGLLSIYDLLALRHAGQKTPYRKVFLISFLSFSLGNLVGSNMIAGGAVRYHLYGRLGIPPRVRLGIIGFVAATTYSGLLVLVAAAGLLAQDFIQSALHLPRWGSIAAALASFLLLIAYLGVTIRDWPLPGWIASRIALPSGSTAFAQISLSALEWMVLAALLYLLLPEAGSVGYFGILLAYLVAILAATVSNVPGGIGVLETVLSLLLKDQIAPEQVVASMLVFRLLLHILPLLIALPVGTIHLLMTPRQQPAA